MLCLADNQIELYNNLQLKLQVIVPSTTCLWVMTVYLAVGTIMFAEWEGWNYLDSVYFCVTSLAKIGFGDFVPGTSMAMIPIDDHDSAFYQRITYEQQIKIVINFVYLLLGMGIVAMCYYLLKEEVTVKIKQFKTECNKRIERMKFKLIGQL